jgi:hypothetical protein
MIIKAVSIKQPWANLIAYGLKDIESRTWQTNYRGPLAIHASKKVDQAGVEWLKGYFLPDEINKFEKSRGAIIGICNLKNIYRYSSERAFLDHFDRHFVPLNAMVKYGWELSNITPLDFPIPYRGALGLFEIDSHLVCKNLFRESSGRIAPAFD